MWFKIVSSYCLCCLPFPSLHVYASQYASQLYFMVRLYLFSTGITSIHVSKGLTFDDLKRGLESFAGISTGDELLPKEETEQRQHKQPKERVKKKHKKQHQDKTEIPQGEAQDLPQDQPHAAVQDVQDRQDVQERQDDQPVEEEHQDQQKTQRRSSAQLHHILKSYKMYKTYSKLKWNVFCI